MFSQVILTFVSRSDMGVTGQLKKSHIRNGGVRYQVKVKVRGMINELLGMHMHQRAYVSRRLITGRKTPEKDLRYCIHTLHILWKLPTIL